MRNAFSSTHCEFELAGHPARQVAGLILGSTLVILAAAIVCCAEVEQSNALPINLIALTWPSQNQTGFQVSGISQRRPFGPRFLNRTHVV
jgi:hypothetical protein